MGLLGDANYLSLAENFFIMDSSPYFLRNSSLRRCCLLGLEVLKNSHQIYITQLLGFVYFFSQQYPAYTLVPAPI